MSLDLTLLPYNNDHADNTYSHTVLPLQTNSRDLFEEIEKLAYITSNSLNFITEEELTGEIPERFSSYISNSDEGEAQYGDLKEDAYGNKVRWVRASVLQGLANHTGVKENLLNKLAWAYINACPPSTKIALYWS